MKVQEDFKKLDKYGFDKNYYTLGKNMTEILEDLSITVNILEKWMSKNSKAKRTKKEKALAVKQNRTLLLSYKISKETLEKEYIVNQLSILALVDKYKIKYGQIVKLLSFYKIPIRGIKDASNIVNVREKYKKTCEGKYGEGIINVSQADEVKAQKASTFLKHYGVDNIRKLPEYYIELDRFMLENYGQKRITNAEKISASRKTFFEENTKQAQDVRIINFTTAKKTWNKMTTEEQEIKMLSMRKSIPKEYYSSQLEYRIKKILDDQLIWSIHQFFMGKHAWDFFLGHKLLLEINGDFWHANPKLYKTNDMLNHRGGEVKAKDIWDTDQKKQKYAIERGFKVFYLWEFDINSYSDKEILNIIMEQINENKINKKD